MKWLQRHVQSIVRGIIALVALGFLGYGCWRAWVPAGFIAVGLALWIDLSLPKRRRGAEGRGSKGNTNDN